MEPYTLEKYKKSRKVWIRVKIGIGVVLGVAFIGGVVYGIYFSPLATDFSLHVEGTDAITVDDFNAIGPMVLSFRLSKNILFLKTEEAQLYLLKKNPHLASVVVEKNIIRRAVTIHAQERKREMVWCVSSACYWVDATGVAFEEAPDIEGLLLVNVHDATRDSMTRGEKVIDSDNVIRIVDFVSALNDRAIPWMRVELKSKESYEAWVLLEQQTVIRISLRTMSQELIEAFFEVLRSIDIAKVDYFDLTVENRIYYKQR